jgi:hypothetical protein
MRIFTHTHTHTQSKHMNTFLFAHKIHIKIKEETQIATSHTHFSSRKSTVCRSNHNVMYAFSKLKKHCLSVYIPHADFKTICVSIYTHVYICIHIQVGDFRTICIGVCEMPSNLRALNEKWLGEIGYAICVSSCSREYMYARMYNTTCKRKLQTLQRSSGTNQPVKTVEDSCLFCKSQCGM